MAEKISISKLDMPVRTPQPRKSVQTLISTQAQQVEPWRQITAVSEKVDLYFMEPSTRSAVQLFDDLTAADKYSLLQRICQVTVKPDGRILGSIPSLLDFMKTHGFTPIYFLENKLSFSHAREIWKFQWNIASIDRCTIFEEMLQLSDPLSIYFFKDNSDHSSMPASVALRSMKGSAIPSLRDGNTLRDALHAPNRIMTLIHAPDEPIDILREFGIRVEHRNLAESILRLLSAARQRSAVGNQIEAQLLEIAALDDLRFQTWSKSSDDPRVLAHLRRIDSTDNHRHNRNNSKNADKIFLQYFTDLLHSRQIQDSELWDALFAGSNFSTHDIPGTCWIDDDGVNGWIEGVGICL